MLRTSPSAVPGGADDYLCWLCTTPQRAYYWDHCHDHGLVRGPVCASCNTFEGNGMVFVNRPGSVEHLLECTVCRAQHTLPRRHYEDVIRNHLAAVHHLECSRAGYVSADPLRRGGGRGGCLGATGLRPRQAHRAGRGPDAQGADAGAGRPGDDVLQACGDEDQEGQGGAGGDPARRAGDRRVPDWELPHGARCSSTSTRAARPRRRSRRPRP
ncbi:endonuclease domain-containing protein [Streptomyces sp. NBC_00984]|uniref:endonuclease domain-containing protein n=1 Tax=Streptomyces sp. NBC_00984 TaxID=2903700 RepID=UPI0038708FBC